METVVVRIVLFSIACIIPLLIYARLQTEKWAKAVDLAAKSRFEGLARPQKRGILCQFKYEAQSALFKDSVRTAQ